MQKHELRKEIIQTIPFALGGTLTAILIAPTPFGLRLVTLPDQPTSLLLIEVFLLAILVNWTISALHIWCRTIFGSKQ